MAVISASLQFLSTSFYHNQALYRLWHSYCKNSFEQQNQIKKFMKLIDSNHSQLLGQAMDAYALRQKVTATNIANVDTPGYRRHEVGFENELQKAQQTNGVKGMKDVTASIMETNEKVLLEDEMIEMSDTQIRVQLVTRSLRHHFDVLRKGITGINR